MVAVDPKHLTYIVETPAGSILLTGDANLALGKLMRSWQELSNQMTGVMSKRLNKATWYRARFDDVVKL